MFTKRNLLYLIFILMIVVGACGSPSEPSPISAALSELTGRVDMKQAGMDAFMPAAANSVLEVNGQIQTGDDGRVRLDLSTGTIIRVAPSSIFTLTSNEETEGGLATKIKLELGKIFIILNGGSTEVETPSGVATVRGSYMKVEVNPETLDVYVTCLEGDCSASNPAGGVNFTNGQKTILFKKNPDGTWTLPNVEPMTPEEFQEWLDNNPEAKELFNQAAGTMTAMAPTATEVPPTQPPTLESPVPQGNTSNACFDIIEPLAGTSLPHQGKVKFSWETQPGAKSYAITFKDADGNLVTFVTTETNFEQYIEVLPKGGEYEWGVTAYGEDGSEICKTEPAIFEKPDSNYVPEPKQEPEEPPCDPYDCYGSCPDGSYCG